MVVTMPREHADWIETLHPDSLGDSIRVRHDIWALTPHTATRIDHIACGRTGDDAESVRHAQGVCRAIERSWG